MADNQCDPGKKLYTCVTVSTSSPQQVGMAIPCSIQCDYTEWFASASIKKNGQLRGASNVSAVIYQWEPGGYNIVEITTTRIDKSAHNKYIVNVSGCNTAPSPSQCGYFAIGVTVAPPGASARGR